MVAAVLRTHSVGLSVTPMSEGELAAQHARQGHAVIVRDGRPWRSAYPGFYQPVHLLTRMRAAEVRQPTPFCWGFRAALADEDADRANASLPVHLLSDVSRFEERWLSRNRRSDLRRCERQVEVRRLESPALLLEQGYDVFRSAERRLGYWKALTEPQYRDRVSRRSAQGRRLIIAGLIEGALRGYLDCYAIDGVLYADEIFVATEALRTGIGTGLHVEAIRVAARHGSIHTVCNGLHRPEHPELTHFKESLGFRIIRVPARAVIRAPLRAYLNAHRPLAYYRLTGDETVLAAIGGSLPAAASAGA